MTIGPRPVASRVRQVAAPTSRRLESVDVLRGAIMVLMALDHTRDFFGIPGQNPVALASTTPALFFTRWITHFCAPGFFLLTGLSAWLTRRRLSTPELSRFLFVRGVWLIVLDLVIARCLVYQFNVDYRVTMLLVLWALGWSMIVLAALVWLPATIVGGIGAIVIASHNLFDTVRLPNPLWSILHVPGVIVPAPHLVFVSYPLVPWIGVAAVGYSLGRIYEWDQARRRVALWRLGAAMTVMFVVLRGIDLYGDPSRWTPRPTLTFTLLSFLNTTKYPPSLLFLLMTLGPMLIVLSMLEGGWSLAVGRWSLVVATFGRVPLVYYLAHFLAIHSLATLVCVLRYGSAHWMFESPDLANYPFTAPPGWGYSLPVVYAIWIAVVAMMYPLCRWFGSLKQRRRDWWLSYT